MTTTNERNCILRTVCNHAGKENICTKLCPFYISMHDEHSGRLKVANIPRDYRNFTITHNPAREAQPEAFEQIDLWASLSFPRMFEENGERIRPLYLYSDEVGTGKTTAACSIANSYLIYHFIGSLKRDHLPPEKVVYYLSFNHWQRKFAEFSHPKVPKEISDKASREFYYARDIAKDVQLLLIDDIGIEDPSPAFTSIALELIDHRVTNRLPIIFTSNVPIEELLVKFDAHKRLYDRIRDQNTQIQFYGTSRRGKRKDFDV